MHPEALSFWGSVVGDQLLGISCWGSVVGDQMLGISCRGSVVGDQLSRDQLSGISCLGISCRGSVVSGSVVGQPFAPLGLFFKKKITLKWTGVLGRHGLLDF